MPLLKNRKHERFAQLVATGISAGEAYKKVYKASPATCETNGPALLRKAQVSARVSEIQGKAESETVLTITEKRAFLRRVVVTSIGEVDEKSDICQAAEYSDTGRKFKMPCKLKAIELDAKLAGEFTEKVEIKSDGLLELLQAIRGGGKSNL